MPQQAMPRRRRRQPVIINETRDNYYLRCSIDSEITLVAAENEALENLSVDNVKTDYAPGEAPRATATTSADDTTNALMVEAAATKPAAGNLAATGDDAALMAAALGIAGATAATAVAAARRRNC